MNFEQDLRFSLRVLGKNPGFVAVAVATLALGISVNCVVFSIINAALLKGLPFPDSGRILHLSGVRTAHAERGLALSYPDFLDWREQSRTFQEMAAFATGTMNLTDGAGEPERVNGAWVTANLFSLLRQDSALGRTFALGDDRAGAEPVALVGHALWMDRFGGDPAVLGRQVRINGNAATVVGVMPKGMKFPYNENLWLALIPTAKHEKRDFRILTAMGRLRPGSSREQAQTELSGIAQRLERQYPHTNEAFGAQVRSWNEATTGMTLHGFLAALLGAVGFVLAIACANLANLLLARAPERRREVSVRMALGAPRWRVVSQLMMESGLIGLVGGLLGWALSIAGIRAFVSAIALNNAPYWIDFSPDFRSLLFLFGISFSTVVLFGLAPAFHATRVDIVELLKAGGRCGSCKSRRLSGLLVTGQLALTVILLFSAGLMMRSLLELQGIDLGVKVDDLQIMRLTLTEEQYPGTTQILAFCDQLVARLDGRPGIESASIMSNSPAGYALRRSFELPDRPVSDKRRLPSASTLAIDRRYFDTLGVRLLRGRNFTDVDGIRGGEVAIVNDDFVERYWPREEPVGKRIRLQRERESYWATVVGVAPPIRQTILGASDAEPILYLPYRQEPIRSFAIGARGRIAPESLVKTIRSAVREVDPELPVYAVSSIRADLQRLFWPVRVFGTLFGVFALIALMLSAMGVYGLIAYSISRRTREIGVRIAVGAERIDILLLFLKESIWRLGVGLTLGLAGAAVFGRLLRIFLVRVAPNDPPTLILIALLLSAVTVISSIIPALRAVRLKPVEALRTE